MKLKNKKILVVGLANKRSIAWGVIKKIKAEGARVGVCYFHESNAKRAIPLSKEMGADFVIEVDVTNQVHIENLANTVSEKWGSLDGLVHSIAFSPAEEFDCRFLECSKEGFFKTLDISAFSLLSLSRALFPYFTKDVSIIAMTYYGSEKVLPGYNLMGVAKSALESIIRYLAEDLGKDGVRVNCISAGAIKTAASYGIPDFNNFLDEIEKHSPLRKNIDTNDIGNMAAFLLSTDASSISGQTMYVDAGMSTIAR